MAFPFSGIGRSAVLLTGMALLASAQHPLIDAIRDQNHKRIASLLAAHTNVNDALADGSTALAWATYLEDSATADLLVAAGADIKASDEYSETPLTLACANGNAHLVEEFLKLGANPNSARSYGETALMIASAAGNPTVLRLLVAHGADVNATETAKGQNALMWAVAEGKTEAVDLLIKSGANPNSMSEAGFTALIFAAEKGDVLSTGRLLAAGAKVNYLLPSKISALLLSATLKKFRVADVLIDHDADVTARDAAGNTALHIAAGFGDANTVKKLIAKGADINAKTGPVATRGVPNFRRVVGQQTALMLAARTNRVDVMRVLSDAGADPKLVAQDGSTLLMAAAASGRLDAVDYAFQLNPDVKSVTASKSAVMHAAVNGTSQVSSQTEICKVIQFLADKGADLDLADAAGRTPLSIAKAVPMEKAADLLAKLIAAPNHATRTDASTEQPLLTLPN